MLCKACARKMDSVIIDSKSQATRIFEFFFGSKAYFELFFNCVERLQKSSDAVLANLLAIDEHEREAQMDCIQRFSKRSLCSLQHS